ncbi:MAG: MmgE/PrpD family protein [Clostridia bacterium]|jgi:2-methylcitrate dehydratase PrpD|nr:MmgE/PrpD family protein [Clostridia bacterium]
MTGKNNTIRLLDYLYECAGPDLGPDVTARVKLAIMDFIASGLAGYRINQVFNEAAYKVFIGLGGKPESTIMLYGMKLPAIHAATINGMIGHGADIDDGHKQAMGHPGVAVIPAVLALAEAKKSSWQEIAAAIVAGYELFVRVARVVNPPHFLRGFHTTGTVGTMAAAAAAAKMMGLPRKEFHHAVSLSALQSAGLLEVTESGQGAKALHPGKAAGNGIFAALLAAAGAGGPLDFLEGEKGFIKAFSGNTDSSPLLQRLGDGYEISGCYYKLYPACRHVHAPIDAALKLNRTGFAAGEIEKVRVHIYPGALKLTGSIYYPQCGDEAKFSLPYTVAVGLAKGAFTLGHLETAAAIAPDVKGLIDKMEIVCDPALEDRQKNIRGTKIEIIFKDGTARMEYVPLPKGDPEVPVTNEDIENKLRSCAENVFSPERAEEIIRAVNHLDAENSILQLSSLLVIEER